MARCGPLTRPLILAGLARAWLTAWKSWRAFCTRKFAARRQSLKPFALAAISCARRIEMIDPASEQGQSIAAASTPIDSFERFAETAEAIAGTTKKLAK